MVNDIAILLEKSSFSGDKTKNHYSFGKRINAPGAGTIIALENNIDDNFKSGTVISGTTLAGNYIMIDHLKGECSMLAHLKKGAIIVSIGDTVVKDQEVGESGNSGNSTGPHLHYHLQNTPDLLEGIGLPGQFRNYSEDDIFKERGEPVRDQFVRGN